MPGQRPQLKLRAELRESTRTTADMGLPGGWWIWCVLGLAIGVGVWFASKNYLRHRLGAQLAQANRTEAMLAFEGLLRLDQRASIEIVRGLASADDLVARTAFLALDRSIGGWGSLSESERHERWHSLAAELENTSQSIPTERLILASCLASRIYAECLECNDARLRTTMELCQTVIERTGRSSSSQTAPGHKDFLAAIDQRIALAAPPGPLPPEVGQFTVSESAATGSLSDAEPPSVPHSSDASGALTDRAQDKRQDSVQSSMPVAMLSATETGFDVTRAPKVALAQQTVKQRMTISDLETNDPPSLSREVERVTVEPEQDASLARTNSVEPETANDDPRNAEMLSGIDSLPIAELVRLLSSVQPRIAQAAALALRRHGMSDDKLELATELATGTILMRSRLVDSVASRGDLDPRPWLLWMAQDGQPEIRRQAIGHLSTMLDQDISRQLRMLLNREQDESVANSIRQALFSAGSRERPLLR